MRVVIDANVAVAALIRPDGWTASQLARDDVEWIAPAFLVDELLEHAEEYARKAACTRAEWQRRVGRLQRRIHVIPAHALLAARGEILDRVARADEDDAPYAAAYLAGGADLIWTRDAALLKAAPGIAVLVVPELE